MKHLKNINENIEDDSNRYEILATNDSYYSWDYDHSRTIAKILLDKSNNSLYLKITNSKSKTGLGAGKWLKELEFINIGNTNKADLKKVRQLLKKYAHEQHKFSTHWEDDEGNKFTLSDLIELYKTEDIKKEKKLKHINSIDSFIKKDEIKTDNTNIELVKYSDKAYAIFGDDTKKIKDKLLDIGCRYNKFLTDPKSGQKKAGWIFPISKLTQIQKILQ